MKINDIAKKANVSSATVDRVLHNRGRVSVNTINRVHDIIKESGFEPNQYARNLRLNKQYRFGVLLRKFTKGEDSYWEILHDGCIAASKELKSLSAELVFEYFDNSEEDSLYSVGKRLLSQHIDGLILAPNSQEDCDKLLADIGSLPYAFVNASFTGALPIIDTSQDCHIAGNTAARIMQMLRPSGKTFATIRRESTSNNSVLRVASFTNYFSSRPDIQVTNYIVDHSDNIRGQIQRFLSECPNMDGIFIVNTATYLYMDYINQISPGLRPAIIGYDAIPKNIELLESNRIDCIISQQPFAQGYNAVQHLYLHQVLGNCDYVEKRAPVTILFKENLASYKATIRERYY